MTMRLGSWARAGGLVGIVAGVDADEVAIFDPGDRQLARVPVADVQPLPAGGVRVTVEVDLPLAHGLEEDSVRRWVASLTDPLLRERAAGALRDAGLDEGPALPAPRVSVEPARGGAVCLCGARTPAQPGSALPCPACGREAVAEPRSGPGAAPA